MSSPKPQELAAGQVLFWVLVVQGSFSTIFAAAVLLSLAAGAWLQPPPGQSALRFVRRWRAGGVFERCPAQWKQTVL